MKLRHLPKKLNIITLVLSLVSCGFLGNDSKAQEGYIVQPNYEHPKFKELDAAFAKQEHRFEIDRCEFKYNDQAFFIGDSYDKIIEIFGEPDNKITKTVTGEALILVYKKLKLTLQFATESKELKMLSMRMSDYEGHKDTPYKIIKFRKVPYQLDMTLNEFSELCDLEHEETLGHTSYTFYIKNEKKCDSRELKMTIGSTAYYDTNDLGGHMTTRGAFDPKSTGPIESLYVGLKKDEK